MAEEALVTAIHHNAEAIAAAFERAPEIVREEIEAGVYEASLLLERLVVEKTPTSGAGTLRESIGALPVVFTGAAWEGGVGTALAYAAPVEEGSKPHMPPLAPLMDWVKRRLGVAPDEIEGVAQAIAWKIFHEGTKAHHMFRDGFRAGEPQVREILAGRIDTALARIAA
ncbi:hypothetical protein DKG74_20530 [Zavarzinia aquatilis]|uniref:HK97 gp10 family phage protein n=1 Tax=Zavarzinia aquatilis TaxID=2211142 RepID=A0A317DSM5_9PROT|nr:hypothetical protein DKG74_20530 [Zavarzinia aquatilis]